MNEVAEQFSDILDSVENSQTDDNAIISESEGFVNNPENGEIDEKPQSALSDNIPRHLVYDESGNLRTDSAGDTFDPAKHVTDENGYPKLTSKGKLRKSRSPKTSRSTIGGSPTPSQVAAKAAVNENAKYEMMGATCANGLISLGLMLGGEDFAPVQNQHIDERQNMTKAFADWCKTREIDDIPPNLALMVVVGSYVLPRMTKPAQVSKLKLLKMWFAAKFTRKPKIAQPREFDPNKKEEN